MITDQDIYAASEARYPHPEQQAGHQPPDQSERDKALDLQTAFEEGAEWALKQVQDAEDVAWAAGYRKGHDDLFFNRPVGDPANTIRSNPYRTMLTSEGLEKRPEADFDIATGRPLGPEEVAE